MNNSLSKLYIICILCFISLYTCSKANTIFPSIDETARFIGRIDSRAFTKGNVEFYFMNNGITAFDYYNMIHSVGGIWPKSSNNLYINGAGIWFGSKKRNKNGGLNPLVVHSYNPFDKWTQMMPGRIEDGDSLFPQFKDKYQVYLSTDYDKSTGVSIDATNTQKWPLWRTNEINHKFQGTYVFDTDKRNTENYPNGPAINSDEVVHLVFKDSYLLMYGSDTLKYKEEGYPTKLQFEMTAYCFDNDKLKDNIIVYYNVINFSNDTLFDCYIANVADIHILDETSYSDGNYNDMQRFYDEMDSLNLGIAWSECDKGELGKNFGYLGISFLMTPAVDANKFIRHDKAIYSTKEQVTTNAFLNIANTEFISSEIKYSSLSDKKIEFNSIPQEVKQLLSVGSFNLIPKDTAKFAIMYSFALPSVKSEPDGSTKDLAGLINNVIYARKYFYDNIITSISNKTNHNNYLSNIIYPNPANNYITINANYINSLNCISNIFDITIYDLLANKQLELNNVDFSTNNVLNIDIFNLNTGVYNIQINNKYKVINEIFVKK